MYAEIFKNSYIVAIIVFIALVVLFYLFQIGYSTSIEYTGEEGCVEKGTCSSTKVVKKFSWRYPLILAIMVWLIWHFCLFPPQDVREMEFKSTQVPVIKPKIQTAGGILSSEANRQKINMINWN